MGVQRRDIGVILGKPVAQPGNALRRLTGLDGFGGAQVIAPASGMGLDIAQRFGLLHQAVEGQREDGMLVDIGCIARVIEVLIGQHAPVIGQMAGNG